MESGGRILKVLGENHGVVTRADLVRAGITKSEIQGAVEAKVLRRVQKRIYVQAGSNLTWEQQLRIGIRATEPHGAVAGASAAALLRFDGFSQGPLQVIVPAKVQRDVEGVTVFRSRDFDPAKESRLVSGLTVTKIPRTLLDLVPLCTERELIVAIEGLIRDLPGVMRGAVTYLRKRANGRPAVLRLADLIFERLFRRPTDSQWEVIAELLVRDAGLVPSRQLKIWRADGSFVAKPDLVYRDHMLVVEIDGKKTHGTPEARVDDGRREALLRAEGYEVVRTTPYELKNDPQGFITRLRARLAERPVKGVPPMSPNPEQLLLAVERCVTPGTLGNPAVTHLSEERYELSAERRAALDVCDSDRTAFGETQVAEARPLREPGQGWR